MGIAIGGISFEAPEPLVRARLPHSPGLYMLGVSSGPGSQESFEPLLVDQCESLAETVRIGEWRIRRCLWERPGALIWVAVCPLSARWRAGEREVLVSRVRRILDEANDVTVMERPAAVANSMERRAKSRRA